MDNLRLKENGLESGLPESIAMTFRVGLTVFPRMNTILVFLQNGVHALSA